MLKKIFLCNFIKVSLLCADSFYDQWSLDALETKKAWQVTRGDKNLAFVIIDSGIDHHHAALRDNIWSDPVDGSHGFNAIDDSKNVLDDNGHGTFTAGGLVSVMPKVSIISCKALDSSGSGTAKNIGKCLKYAAHLAQREDLNITIVGTINPYVGGGQDQEIFNEIKEHERLGIFFITTAGNEASNIDDTDLFPASYDLENVLVTAKMNKNYKLTNFSSYGPKTVDVAMPGLGIITTGLNNSFVLINGSVTAGLLAGVIGLTKAAHPRFTFNQVREKLFNSIDLLSTEEEQSKIRLGGFVNAFKCVSP